MEKSTTNNVALLGDIMEGLAQEDGESSIQAAVCALVGVAEDSIENAAENLAQALGLKKSNSLMQTRQFEKIHLFKAVLEGEK